MTTDPRPEDELQLSDYVLIMRRRWTWIALTVVSIMVAAVLLTIARGPRFSATAQVGLGDSAAQEAIRSNSFTNVGAASRELSNEVNLALSDAVTSEVENQLGLDPSINIIADTESDALRFEAEADTAEATALHANTWAQVYVDTKRRQATDSISEAVEVFQRDLAELRADRQELRQPLDALESQIAAVTDEEQKSLLQTQLNRLNTDLAMEFDLLDIQVQAVAENITSLELSSRLASTGTARIVQVAAPPQSPASGSLLRNLMLATFVGLVMGAVVALVAENLDRTIKTTEDVASLGIPVLGGIPTPGRTVPEAELPLATMRHTGTPVAEAYQKVRTAVEFALLGRQINSLLITSPNQSEGKTTLSVNLAWAMSAVDHRVALVDVDFRRPRIHEVFNCPAQPGLSDNLISGVPLPQLALRVDEAGSRNLIMMPTGTQPPSPADFVASPAFTSLIRKIEAEADLVILDAPPVLPVSDAPSIGRQVDAVIVVVKAGSTTRDQLTDTIDDLRGVGADIIGVCVVGLKTSPNRYGNYGKEVPRPRVQLRSERRSRVVDVRHEPDPAEPELDDYLLEPLPPTT
ncbi:MAG: polysaccharide biosynthesis tyrosine autokinase [Actinomycetia bacterium]|nr:polysaccharide biosynthesis tyrosine autokinase [Actinomycetes bacterium]MCP5033256.1 polysaccharide biosynthesis tyrosine autokinase [Actinomycetes bacterium]